MLTPADPFQPLAGVRVVDFTRVLAGPYATMLLAELGADVIKIERPGVGDDTRAWGPPFVEESAAYFHAVNRGKRSVALDLSDPDGRATADALIATADVLIENFRPGVTARLGIDAPSLAERFPRLVHVSMTGFGSTGPMRELAGTEVIVEAESGLMGITGHPGGEPVRFGVAMVDMATGLSAVSGLLAALLERERTGRGRQIEVSLYGTALSSLGTVIAAESAGRGDAEPRRWGSGHASIVPYCAFPCTDGFVVLGATNEGMWQRLCRALGLDGPVALNPGWDTNAGRVADRDAVEAAVGAVTRSLPCEQVIARLQEHGVLVAPVMTPGDAARSAQAAAIDQVGDDGDHRFARSPLAASGTAHLGRAPSLGQHTDDVLGEIAGTTTKEPNHAH